jgi:hypothetical protein
MRTAVRNQNQKLPSGNTKSSLESILGDVEVRVIVSACTLVLADRRAREYNYTYTLLSDT